MVLTEGGGEGKDKEEGQPKGKRFSQIEKKGSGGWMEKKGHRER